MIEKIKHKNLALFILAGAQFLVVLDATIVNIALPSIQRALDFSSNASLQWVVTAYTLLFGGFLLLGGRLADLYGRRRLFMAGLIVFAVASMLGGFAQSPAQLIALRGLQGLGGALLSPAALSLVLIIFKEGKERNKALGVWSAVAAGGGAVGLLLGGVLTQYIDWRWVFFINVPVAIILLILAYKYVPKSLANTDVKHLDLFGASAITAGLMTLVYALVKAPEYGWTDAKTIVIFGASVLLLVIAIINESRVKKPLIPLSIFKIRNVSAANLMQLPVAAAMFATFFFLTLYLQEILNYSPVVAGVASLPFTLFIGVVAGIVSKVVHKTGPRPILILAPLLMGAGLLYFSRLPVDGNYWIDVLPGIAFMASGMAATFVTITLAATSGVPHHESGLASGLLNTSQQIGGAIGLAILSAVSTTQTTSMLALAKGDPAASQLAVLSGFHYAFFVAACIVLVSVFVALFMLKNVQPSENKESLPV